MSKNKEFSSTSTNRYSLALYELANESNTLVQCEENSFAFLNLINDNKDFNNLIKDPTISKGILMNIINKISENSKLDISVPQYFSTLDPENGKELYGQFCSHCHGEKGDGNGILMQREKILGIPGYGRDRLPDITPGSIYHVIMHGKNNMGSHSSQLNYDERWKIIKYVLKLREDQSAIAAVDAEAK